MTADHPPANEDDQEQIRHFPLAGLLPPGHLLALNLALGILSWLTVVNGSSRLLCEEHFTRTETTLLLPLLAAYPDYCPYELLYASYHGSTSEAAVSRARRHLQEAQQAGIWDEEMRPVRNLLSRARLTLHHLGLEVVSLFETGYLLLPRKGSLSHGGERNSSRTGSAPERREDQQS